VARRGVPIIAVALLLAACSGGGSGGAATSASGPTSAPTLIALPSPNQDLLSQLTALGVPIDDATFLAGTTFEVTAPSDKSAHVVEQLASGDVVEFTVTVEPTDLTPGTATATGSTTNDEIHVNFRYVVAAEDLPDDIRQLLTAAAGHLALAAAGSAPVLTADVSFFQVTIDWALKKVQSTIRDSAIKAIVEKVSPNQVGPIMSILKAVGTISKLDELDQKLRDLLKKLQDLEDCAKNPTNPLTIKQYQQEPGARDRILEDIAEARNELLNNTIVAELGVLNGAIASLGPKWLGYVIGPGTDWAKATLQEINQERVDQVDREVTKCDCPVGVSSGGGSTGGGSGGGSSGGGTSGGGTSGGGTSGSGSGPTCEVPLTWVGTVDYSIKRDDQVIFTAHATNVSWKLNPALSEGTVTTYELEVATINWNYHEALHDDCTVVDGNGSEPGLPNEEASGGGESGGPPHPGEQASLVVHWTDVPMNRPTPFYLGSAHVRLHDGINWDDSCHSEHSVFDPDALDFTLGNWLSTPVDPFPVIENGTMSGTWTDTVSPYLSRTWTWKFVAGGK
jgi:uncharacterized membrane protein YgcG